MDAEKLAEKLHEWYLEATKNLNLESYNPDAQKKYLELTDEQRYIDRFIANKILELQKTIELEGWQGKSGLTITREKNTWTIIEHRKERESKEVKTITHEITQANVQAVWTIIQANLKIGGSTTSKKLAEKLILSKAWGISTDAFWGGKYRSKYYFPKFYYPLKILDYNKLITYSSGGKITRVI